MMFIFWVRGAAIRGMSLSDTEPGFRLAQVEAMMPASDPPPMLGVMAAARLNGRQRRRRAAVRAAGAGRRGGVAIMIGTYSLARVSLEPRSWAPGGEGGPDVVRVPATGPCGP